MNVPILNLEERNAIVNPEDGFTIYRSDLPDHYDMYSTIDNRWRGYIFSEKDSQRRPLPPIVIGQSFTIEHKMINGVAPEDITITYNTIKVPATPNICWLNKNLGATKKPVSAIDTDVNAAGWYFQFNRKKGHIRTTLGEIEIGWDSNIRDNSDWLEENDPAFLELGYGWRLPTIEEWMLLDNTNKWSNYNQPFTSALKLHCAGACSYYDGKLEDRGGASKGIYWSKTQSGSVESAMVFKMMSSQVTTSMYRKSTGLSIRPVRDLI